MKKSLLYVFLLFLSLCVLSCGDDDTKTLADELITANRLTGKIYKINKSTGALTEISAFFIDEDTLKELRGFVYHPKTKLYYATASTEVSQSGNPLGQIYSINPSSKVATEINDNGGGTNWYAINNFVIMEDDSLMGVGYFRSSGDFGSGPGLLKFSTNGQPAASLISRPDVCCGNGMLHFIETGITLIASSRNSNNGEVIIETIEDGDITDSQLITDFVGFPDDLSADWLNVKAMVLDDEIYALLYDYETGKTYFVKIDLDASEITYVSTLGLSTDQYNMLAIVPGKHAK